MVVLHLLVTPLKTTVSKFCAQQEPGRMIRRSPIDVTNLSSLFGDGCSIAVSRDMVYIRV